MNDILEIIILNEVKLVKKLYLRSRKDYFFLYLKSKK